MTASDIIWIVERVRNEQYGQSKRVVSWHKSRDQAEGMATRLQAEFEHACVHAWPCHEVVETIYEMLEEQEYRNTCGPTATLKSGSLENPHQHHTQVESEEHEEALIEQLKTWWHRESLANIRRGRDHGSDGRSAPLLPGARTTQRARPL